MQERIPEPELMDGPVQAQAYAEADFISVNAGFVAELAAHFRDLGPAPAILDLGCGPGDIPVRLARALPGARITAVDGAPAMTAYAEQAVTVAGLAGRVRVVTAALQELDEPRRPFDLVVSNSLLHHLHRPEALWEVIRQQGVAGTAVYVMDLMRPDSREEVDALVAAYAAREPEQLREDFRHSLHAAFTPEEVREQLQACGCAGLQVRPVSDRHLLVSGRLGGHH